MIAWCLRRPVPVAALCAALGVLGILSARSLRKNVASAALPRLYLEAGLPIATAEAAEALVTAPLERAVRAVPGVRRVQSVTQEAGGASFTTVKLEFTSGTPMALARHAVSERVAAARKELPPGVRGPFIRSYMPAQTRMSDAPTLRLALHGDVPGEALRDAVKRVLLPDLLGTRGVAAVTAWGERPPRVDVQIDLNRVAALGSSVTEVERALATSQFAVDAGAVAGRSGEAAMVIENGTESADELGRTSMPGRANAFALSDVASLRDILGEPRAITRVDGKPAVAVNVFREADSDALDVVERVESAIARATTSLPSGVRIDVLEDEAAATRVRLELALSGTLIALALLLFLVALSRRSRHLLIAQAAVVTVATLGALNVAAAMRMRSSIAMAAGLVLALPPICECVGALLADVRRRIRRGRGPTAALLIGAREQVLPSFGTLGVVAIVALVAISTGEPEDDYLIGIARLSLTTLAMGIAATCAVAPALLSKTGTLVDKRQSRGFDHHATQSRGRLEVLARRVLPTWQRHDRAVAAMALLVAIGAVGTVVRHQNLATPASSSGDRISVTVQLPVGTDVIAADTIARMLESEVASSATADRYDTIVQPERIVVRVDVIDSLRDTRAPYRLADRLSALGSTIGGANVQVVGFTNELGGLGTTEPRYGVVVTGYAYEGVASVAHAVAAKLQLVPQAQDIDDGGTDGSLDARESAGIEIRPDRARIADLGLTIPAVLRELAYATAGQRDVQVARHAGGRSTVVLRTARVDTPLEQMLARTIAPPAGGSVRLADLVAVSERHAPSRIVREQQQYTRVVSFAYRGPERVARRVASDVARRTDAPDGYRITEYGQRENGSRSPDDGVLRWRWAVAALSVFAFVGLVTNSAARATGVAVVTIALLPTLSWVATAMTPANSLLTLLLLAPAPLTHAARTAMVRDAWRATPLWGSVAGGIRRTVAHARTAFVAVAVAALILSASADVSTSIGRAVSLAGIAALAMLLSCITCLVATHLAFPLLRETPPFGDIDRCR